MVKNHFESSRVLEIDNAHVEDCGTPPTIDAAGKYVSYFENQHGEQWVFIGDPQTGKAELYGGDAGWERKLEISVNKPYPDAVLNGEEQVWILACFMALTGKSFEEVQRAKSKHTRLVQPPRSRFNRFLFRVVFLTGIASVSKPARTARVSS